jgi:hypothetical protein
VAPLLLKPQLNLLLQNLLHPLNLNPLRPLKNPALLKALLQPLKVAESWKL